MCGLLFVHKKEGDVSRIIEKRYRAQKGRGSQGFGFIVIDEGKIQEWSRSETEKEILELLRVAPKGNTILFHHRMPTSTPNYEEATHPIKVSNPLLDHEYFVIHNGMITNDEVLKEKHEELGFVYTTQINKVSRTATRDIVTSSCFNDSEALAIELAMVADGKKKECQAKGSIAFIMLQVKKGTDMIENVYFGRNHANPLKFNTQKEFFSLTSEGHGSDVSPNILHRFNLKDNKFYELDLTLTGYYPEYSPRASSVGFSERDLAELGLDRVTDYRNKLPIRMGFNTDPEMRKPDWSANNLLPAGKPEAEPEGDWDSRDPEDDFVFDVDTVLVQLYDESKELEAELDVLLTYRPDAPETKKVQSRLDYVKISIESLESGYSDENRAEIAKEIEAVREMIEDGDR